MSPWPALFDSTSIGIDNHPGHRQSISLCPDIRGYVMPRESSVFRRTNGIQVHKETMSLRHESFVIIHVRFWSLECSQYNLPDIAQFVACAHVTLNPPFLQIHLIDI